jgi:hypothetical protein
MTLDDAELLFKWLLRQYPVSERPPMPTLAHGDDNHQRHRHANRDRDGRMRRQEHRNQDGRNER